MLVKSYMDTYKFPANITNCSNNYGPYQFPEKRIPLIINNALQGKKLPVYGDGKNVRDWLYVEDHCKAIDLITTSILLSIRSKKLFTCTSPAFFRRSSCEYS